MAHWAAYVGLIQQKLVTRSGQRADEEFQHGRVRGGVHERDHVALAGNTFEVAIDAGGLQCFVHFLTAHERDNEVAFAVNDLHRRVGWCDVRDR